MKYLFLILAQLWRHRLRTLLTWLSIVVAFILYGYLAAVRIAFAYGVTIAGENRLIIHHRVSLMQPLPISYRRQLQHVPGVEVVVPEAWFGGIYQDPKNYFEQVAVDAEAFLKAYPEYVLSKEAIQRWLRTRIGAIVGPTTAKRFGWKVGDHIVLLSTLWPKKNGSYAWEFEIVGIYKPAKRGSDTSTMFFHYDYLDETRLYAKGWVNWYAITIRDPEKAPQIAKQIDAMFANSSYETKTEPEQMLYQNVSRQIGDIGTIVTLVSTAVFVTILLIIGNTMARSVRERTMEIGVLKTLGYQNKTILWFILTEAWILTFTGGLLGMAIAYLLVAQGDPTGGFLIIFYIPKKDFLWSICWMFLLGLGAGLPPAIGAMRLKIVEALRRVAV